MEKNKVYPKELKFYLPLSVDVELEITVQTRFYNGIASDPKILVREPSVGEMRQLQEAMRKAEPGLKWESGLNY